MQSFHEISDLIKLFSHLKLLDLHVFFRRDKWQQCNISSHLGERPVIQHQSSRSEEPVWQIREGKLSLHVLESSSGPMYIAMSQSTEAF